MRTTTIHGREPKKEEFRTYAESEFRRRVPIVRQESRRGNKMSCQKYPQQSPMRLWIRILVLKWSPKMVRAAKTTRKQQ